MSLTDALKTAPKTKSRGNRIDEILSVITGPEQQALKDALSDTAGWPSDALARTLREQGHGVSESSVRRYRKNVLSVRG